MRHPLEKSHKHQQAITHQVILSLCLKLDRDRSHNRKEAKRRVQSWRRHQRTKESRREERANKCKKVAVSSKKKKAAPTHDVQSFDEELAQDLLESDDESVKETDDVPLAPKDNITENTHVLVRYETGKQNVYYAGCVEKCDEDLDRVNFMRKVGSAFVYPETEHVHDVGYEQTTLLLGEPVQSGGTHHVKMRTSFHINLNGYPCTDLSISRDISLELQVFELRLFQTLS